MISVLIPTWCVVMSQGIELMNGGYAFSNAEPASGPSYQQFTIESVDAQIVARNTNVETVRKAKTKETAMVEAATTSAAATATASAEAEVEVSRVEANPKADHGRVR